LSSFSAKVRWTNWTGEKALLTHKLADGQVSRSWVAMDAMSSLVGCAHQQCGCLKPDFYLLAARDRVPIITLMLKAI